MPKASPWYKISAGAASAGEPPAAELHIFGDIGENFWEPEMSITARTLAEDLAKIDPTARLTVRINSVGGSVMDGLAIYNALRRRGCVTAVEGGAYSIASLIAQAGTTRKMAKNAVMMVHAPMTGVRGNAQELRDAADMLDLHAEAMANSYANDVMAAETILAILKDKKDHYYTAEQALEAGLIDEITDEAPEATAMAVRAIADARFRKPPLSPTAKLAGAISPKAEDSKMPEATKPVTPGVSQEDHARAIQAARDEALKMERDRRSAVSAVFRNRVNDEGAKPILEAALEDPSVTEDVARARLLAYLDRAPAEPANPPGHTPRLSAGVDAKDKLRDQVVNALLTRAGKVSADAKDPVERPDAQNEMRGWTLLRMAEACLEARGVSARGMSRNDVVAAAVSQTSSDFPVFFETAMYKQLLTGFTTPQPYLWRRLCAIGSVSDFRPSNRYWGGLWGDNLASVGEGQEYGLTKLLDGYKTYVQVSTKGVMLNVTRQMLINDDLGVITGVAPGLGQLVARSMENDFWAEVAANRTIDGAALFSASHANLAASGAQPSQTVLQATRTALRKMMDPNGKDYIDVMPSMFVGAPGLDDIVAQCVGAPYQDEANKFQKPNPVLGMFSRDQILATPRITDTKWYLWPEPSVSPIIEATFLDGNQTPYLEMQPSFTTDGFSTKIRLDYAFNTVGWRGSYMNPGA